DHRRQRAQVLRLGPARHPEDRNGQERRADRRQPRARQGGEEQGGAAVSRGEFDILYGVGVNAPGEIVDLASAAGLFEKSGAFYSFRGERIAQGRDKACAYVAEHPELAEEVRRLLLEARKAENA